MDYEGEFNEIWKLYPRRVARRRALGAYRQRRKEGMTFEEAMAAVKAYASERKGEEERFTMHCASFFGKIRRGWEDYVTEDAEGRGGPDHYLSAWW